MLDAATHSRIIADISNVCRTANIPQNMLWQSATQYCSTVELDWLRHFNVNKKQGRNLLLTGNHMVVPEVKMMSMAAALIRNFKDARLVTVNTIVDAHDDKVEIPDPSIMFIPNLYVRQGGKSLPSWKAQIIYDVLLDRLASSKPVVAYVEDLEAMGKEYGNSFVQHFKAHYTISNS